VGNYFIMHLKLILPLPTSINDLYSNHYSWNPKTKSRVPTGAKVLSKEGERVKELIQVAAREQLAEQEWDYDYTYENYLFMDAIIYFNRTGRDDNNIYKLNNDALEKIVYDNDSRVLTRTQRIYYDKDNPRIELTFSKTDYIGIFDNQDHLNSFEDNCKKCKRYKNNCSILKKAKEGRIQEKIVEFVCSSFK
jgi:Holliday junction resolvase RusA-like endonuclease